MFKKRFYTFVCLKLQWTFYNWRVTFPRRELTLKGCAICWKVLQFHLRNALHTQSQAYWSEISSSRIICIPKPSPLSPFPLISKASLFHWHSHITVAAKITITEGCTPGTGLDSVPCRAISCIFRLFAPAESLWQKCLPRPKEANSKINPNFCFAVVAVAGQYKFGSATESSSALKWRGCSFFLLYDHIILHRCILYFIIDIASHFAICQWEYR